MEVSGSAVAISSSAGMAGGVFARRQMNENDVVYTLTRYSG